MRLIVIHRKSAGVVIFGVIAILLMASFLFWSYEDTDSREVMVMGGRYFQQTSEESELMIKTDTVDSEKYFRPSDLPILNDRYSLSFFDAYYDKKPSDIGLPGKFMKTPEETILNYYSILREAANFEEGKTSGCGTVGNVKIPYPIAYNFLASSYQKKMPYEKYLDTFKNILHINLIKSREVPGAKNISGDLRYFVEIETLEGSENNITHFAYYYGFIDMVVEEGQYKISNLDFYGEDFLCAPYHGWNHNAELSVQIRYGNWCSMIEKIYPTKQEGYVKYIPFKGTDGKDYRIEFYQLTNDTDIEIAQYTKDQNGKWQQVYLDPNKCIKE